MESGMKMVMTMTVLTNSVWCEDSDDYDSTH